MGLTQAFKPVLRPGRTRPRLKPWKICKRRFSADIDYNYEHFYIPPFSSFFFFLVKPPEQKLLAVSFLINANTRQYAAKSNRANKKHWRNNHERPVRKYFCKPHGSKDKPA